MFDIVKDKLKKFKGLISLGYKDLNSKKEFYYREKEIFPAASIIKIPILVEFLRCVEKGNLSFEQKIILKGEDKVGGAGILFELHEGMELTLLDLAKLMFVISDNTATNILLSFIGFNKVNNLMKLSDMESSCLRRKMMIPYRHEEENITSVKDIVLFIEQLVTGKLLSPSFTYKAIKILKRQQYREKIPLYIPEHIEIANKTGELEGIRHDAAIIYLPETTYILVIMTESKNKFKADRTIAKISELIYKNSFKELCSNK